MRQFTTNEDTIKVCDADLTEAKVYVTYAQGSRKVTVTDVDVAFNGKDSVVTIKLDQSQTGTFTVGKANVQVNWVIDGERFATDVREMTITQNLLAEVIEA